MTDEVWKRPDVAMGFLAERSRSVPYRREQIEVLLRLLRSAARPPRRVLDLGAGDGLLLAAVLGHFPQAEGVAVDYSPPMLEQARLRLAPFGARATVVAADLASPLWQRHAPGPFDAVVSSLAIHHLPHDRKRALYGEIYSLLAGGGSFVNCEHVASPSPRLERLFDDAMSEHIYEWRRQRGEAVTLDAVRREYSTRPDRAANILAPVEEQCGWLREIGFCDVDCFWKFFELAVFGGTRPEAAGDPC